MPGADQQVPEGSHTFNHLVERLGSGEKRTIGEADEAAGQLSSTRTFWLAVVRVCVLLGLLLLLLASSAGAQMPEGLPSTPVPHGDGWSGFTDLDFLLAAFLNLVLAGVLGAVIGYHPRRIRTADTLEEIEAPKVSIVYAVIGSLIGILVVKYGLYMGFVLFGIGALIRFRTVMRSAQLTGQVIFVTLIGLTCGLELPHVAVLATAFDFVLTFLLEARITYRVDVRGLPADCFSEAADAYRTVLDGGPYRVLSETKRPDKASICFIFRSSDRDTREQVEGLFDESIDPSLRGSLNWEVD